MTPLETQMVTLAKLLDGDEITMPSGAVFSDRNFALLMDRVPPPKLYARALCEKVLADPSLWEIVEPVMAALAEGDPIYGFYYRRCAGKVAAS